MVVIKIKGYINRGTYSLASPQVFLGAADMSQPAC